MNKRQFSMALLATMTLAGCASPGSNPSARVASDAPVASTGDVVRYHHEVISEDNDGDTKFLRLVQDNEIPSWP
jgi:hypothetical protein